MSVRERTSGKPLLATTAGRVMAPGLATRASGNARRQPMSLRQALARASAETLRAPLAVVTMGEATLSSAQAWDAGRSLPRWVDAARLARGRSRVRAAKGWLATIVVTGVIIGMAAHFLVAHPRVPAPVAARAN